MAIPIKTSMFSESVNKTLLKSGAMGGFDHVVLGAGSGAALGAINGAFSEYDGLIGSTMKGAVMGAGAGVGMKYLGTKYTRGFQGALTSNNIALDQKILKKSAPSNDIIENMLKVNSSYARNPINKGASWFDVELPHGYDRYSELLGVAK